MEKVVVGVWGCFDLGLGFDISEVCGCYVGFVVVVGVDCLGFVL